MLGVLRRNIVGGDESQNSRGRFAGGWGHGTSSSLGAGLGDESGLFAAMRRGNVSQCKPASAVAECDDRHDESSRSLKLAMRKLLLLQRFSLTPDGYNVGPSFTNSVESGTSERT